MNLDLIYLVVKTKFHSQKLIKQLFMKRKFVLILAIVCFSQPGFAYIDPFTGSFIIQAILAFFVTVAFYLGYPIRLIKKIYKKLSKKKKNNK